MGHIQIFFIGGGGSAQTSHTVTVEFQSRWPTKMRDYKGVVGSISCGERAVERVWGGGGKRAAFLPLFTPNFPVFLGFFWGGCAYVRLFPVIYGCLGATSAPSHAVVKGSVGKPVTQIGGG